MKKLKFLYCVAFVLILCGCGSLISQEEYDEVVSQRDAYLESVDILIEQTEIQMTTLQAKTELETKIELYKDFAESELDYAKTILDFLARNYDIETDEYMARLDESYIAHIFGLDQVLNIVDLSGQAEAYLSASETADNLRSSWGDTVNVIFDALKN